MSSPGVGKTHHLLPDLLLESESSADRFGWRELDELPQGVLLSHQSNPTGVVEHPKGSVFAPDNAA